LIKHFKRKNEKAKTRLAAIFLFLLAVA